MGASWIFGNHEGTLKALAEKTRKNGIIIAGEPYWIKRPSDWYLEVSEIKYSDFASFSKNIEIGKKINAMIKRQIRGTLIITNSDIRIPINKVKRLTGAVIIALKVFQYFSVTNT